MAKGGVCGTAKEDSASSFSNPKKNLPEQALSASKLLTFLAAPGSRPGRGASVAAGTFPAPADK